MGDRIVFPGNPWPDGHAVRSFAWRGRLEPSGLFFELDVETADYAAEGPGRETGGESSWKSPIVWNNYHACHIRADGRGFRVATERKKLHLSQLAGASFSVDMRPKHPDDAAFHIYLLGHDSVAKHEIRFDRRNDDGTFALSWRGRICLSYAGATATRTPLR